MAGLTFNRDIVTGPLSSALVKARRARFFVRRMGPNITINVIFTNVDPPSVPQGDVITTVNVGVEAGQPPAEAIDDRGDSGSAQEEQGSE
ncbi:MAG: hypothetical protein KDC39_02595 [Actinobacteria bacterium]|nr:hypothetical protein [Actinomycetota bacterium]